MSTLWIAEFNELGSAPVAQCPPVAQQKVTFSASAASAAFVGRWVRVMSDADCVLKFGEGSISATLDDTIKLTAGSPEYFGVTAGHKVAAIAAA